MGEVVKLKLVEVGESFRFNPDELLEDAKGQEYATVVIIGQDEDGEVRISGTANAGETLILMELAKLKLVRGER